MRDHASEESVVEPVDAGRGSSYPDVETNRHAETLRLRKKGVVAGIVEVFPRR
jgi:hypothetical protein